MLNQHWGDPPPLSFPTLGALYIGSDIPYIEGYSSLLTVGTTALFTAENFLSVGSYSPFPVSSLLEIWSDDTPPDGLISLTIFSDDSPADALKPTLMGSSDDIADITGGISIHADTTPSVSRIAVIKLQSPSV